MTYTARPRVPERCYERVLRLRPRTGARCAWRAAQHQRVRWWAALALLRCVTSSPAAAAATLAYPRQRSAEGPISVAQGLDALGERAVLDLDSADAADGDDVVPGADTVEGEAPEASERRRLRSSGAGGRRAGRRQGPRSCCGRSRSSSGLLDDGFSPVVYLPLHRHRRVRRRQSCASG